MNWSHSTNISGRNIRPIPRVQYSSQDLFNLNLDSGNDLALALWTPNTFSGFPYQLSLLRGLSLKKQMSFQCNQCSSTSLVFFFLNKKRGSWILDLLSLLSVGSLSRMRDHKVNLANISCLICPSDNIRWGQAMEMDAFSIWYNYLDCRSSK